jgi:hypothetical protein
MRPREGAGAAAFPKPRVRRCFLSAGRRGKVALQNKMGLDYDAFVVFGTVLESLTEKRQSFPELRTHRTRGRTVGVLRELAAVHVAVPALADPLPKPEPTILGC